MFRKVVRYMNESTELLNKYREPLKKLSAEGTFYYNVRKKFVGKVNGENFFTNPSLIINTLGYYPYNDTWRVFITDEERGLELTTSDFSDEESAIKYLIELCENQAFFHYRSESIANFEEKETIIFNHLQAEYGYSPLKAKKAVMYLLQVKVIAFEYSYFIEHGEYVPDKFASNFGGYTAKRIHGETRLTVLGAFNYMVYIKKNREEALSNLRKGLPIRKVFRNLEGNPRPFND